MAKGSGPQDEEGQALPPRMGGKSSARPQRPSSGAKPAARQAQSGSKILLFVGLGLTALLLIGGGIVAAVVLPMIERSQAAARSLRCQNNLRQIAIALHSYEGTYGSLPPAFVANAEGKPMYSWRVLILPFLEQQALYEKFDLLKPWNDPANADVLNQMPPVFGCSSQANDSKESASMTSYAAPFGARCLFRSEKPVRFADVRDGLEQTILVGETTGAKIFWTAPGDVAVVLGQPLGSPGGFASPHGQTVSFVFGDGTLRELNSTVPNETMLQLFQIDDGVPPAGSY